MFRRKLLALIGVLFVALLTAVPASAQSNAASVTDLRLAPGSTVCLTPLYAINSVTAQGTANNAGANFVLYNGAVNATNPIFTALNSNGFYVTFSSSFPQGATFPGKFKLCATNPSTTNNTRISMSLSAS
jgi:hypothetical protein